MPHSQRRGTRDLGRARWSRLAVCLAVLLALPAVLQMPTGYLMVLPGPVRSLQGLVSVEGYPVPETSFHMVAVIAREANVLGVLKAAFSADIGLWGKGDVYGGRTPEEYIEDSRVLMDASQKTAVYLGFLESGFALTPQDPLPACVSVETEEVLGPSAGLAFALEMIATLRGVDLSMGRRTAATGILNQDGQVAAVGGIAQKVIACREEGIALFIVPALVEAEALRYAGSMQVLGVRTLREAVEYLLGCGAPGQHAPGQHASGHHP